MRGNNGERINKQIVWSDSTGDIIGNHNGREILCQILQEQLWEFGILVKGRWGYDSDVDSRQ